MKSTSLTQIPHGVTLLASPHQCTCHSNAHVKGQSLPTNVQIHGNTMVWYHLWIIYPCDRGLEMVESHPKSWKVAVWLNIRAPGHLKNITPAKFKSWTLKSCRSKRNVAFLPSFFRGYAQHFTSLLKAAEIIEMFPTCGGNIWCKVLMRFTQKLGCFFFKTSVHSAKKILPHDEIVVSGRCCLGK